MAGLVRQQAQTRSVPMMFTTRKAILGLAILILAVEGFLVYRWYEQRSVENTTANESTDTPSRTAVASDPSVDENMAADDATGELRGEDAFVHRATSENIVDNSTYIDHPAANDNRNAVVLVTQLSRAGVEVENASTVGVWFDANRDRKWAIFNQDLAPMPEGTLFTVVVLEPSEDATFVHKVTPTNTVENVTYLNYPLTNDSPDAILSVTPNWNPGGGAGVYNNHPIEVRYDSDEGMWTIVNQDLASFSEGTAFDVLALPR